MWRRYVGPLIGLGVFLVLLVIVLATQGGGNATPTPQSAATPTQSAAERDLQILNLGATETINGLEIKTVTSTVTLRFENNLWKQTAPTQRDLDSAVISDTLRQLKTLRGDTLIPQDRAGDLNAFGLTQPSMTVTLSTSGSGTKVLNFGARNPATNNYYVKLSDDPKVWTINNFYVNTFQSWLTNPPTPAPTIAPTGQPLTPLPSVTPTVTPGGTTAAATTPATTTTAPATTSPPATTPAATPAAPTTTAPPTTTASS